MVEDPGALRQTAITDVLRDALRRLTGTMIKSLLGFSTLALLTGLTGCPKKTVTIYRNLSEPGAMETCNANTRFRVEGAGTSPRAARANAEAQIRNTVAKNKGCGALVYNEAAGKTMDGRTSTYFADYQLCTCR